MSVSCRTTNPICFVKTNIALSVQVAVSDHTADAYYLLTSLALSFGPIRCGPRSHAFASIRRHEWEETAQKDEQHTNDDSEDDELRKSWVVGAVL